MRRWALVTIALYGAILAVLVAPVTLAAFQSKSMVGLALSFWPVWAFLGMMVLAQIALLVVPVRMANDRSVSHLSLLWTLAAAFLMLLVLLAGMVFVASETLGHWDADSTTYGIVLCTIGAIWLLWALVFGFYTGGREPRTMMSRLARFLIAGSVLELLVAIPAHVYARSKDSCCGGFQTVWGLAAGIAVMIFAFGPAVFTLFARRLGSIRPPRSAGVGGTETS